MAATSTWGRGIVSKESRVVHPLPKIEQRSLSELTEDRWVALVTSEPAWQATTGRLRLPEVWRAEPIGASEGTFDTLAKSVPADAEVIYAVGDGLVVDAAKLAASRRQLPLVAIPTALSTDAYLTATCGVRRGGGVAYVETGPASRVIVDWDVIAGAPTWERAAAICDVLSIATASWDWVFAEGEDKNPRGQEVVTYAARIAEAIVDDAMTITESIGTGEADALLRLLDLQAMAVQLCNLLGHTRPKEGSEHLFAFAVEPFVESSLSHGDLVGPGIVAMAAAQGQDPGLLHDALLSAGTRLDRIPRDAAARVLLGLPDFVRKYQLPFGIANVLDDDRIELALATCWDGRG